MFGHGSLTPFQTFATGTPPGPKRRRPEPTTCPYCGANVHPRSWLCPECQRRLK